jgi:putative hydroxymethylpyrimidine transport system ATP-binding protein
MQQRVSFARALLTEQPLLVLDEPFSALDGFTRQQMQQWLLEQLHDLQLTVIMVTHQLEEALLLSDTIVLLKEGTLMQQWDVPLTRPRQISDVHTPDIQALRTMIERHIFS